MGYIYKITNKINGKIYIGQTIKTVEKRFIQHKNNSNKEYFSQIILYKAFNKYGIENFVCEEIEEVPNEFLNEREKYWIEYYNSYLKGYNSTIGGRSVPLYNWDLEDVVEKYQELKSARKVAEFFGCDHNTIDNLLNINNIPRFSSAQQQSKPVILCKNDKTYEFETTTQAAEWLIETKQTTSKKIRNIRQYITRMISNGKTYLGYNIFYK